MANRISGLLWRNRFPRPRVLRIVDRQAVVGSHHYRHNLVGLGSTSNLYFYLLGPWWDRSYLGIRCDGLFCHGGRSGIHVHCV